MVGSPAPTRRRSRRRRGPPRGPAAGGLAGPGLAEIRAHGVAAGPDSTLQHQPSRAIARACEKEGITPADLDLVEINEAFAAVGLASTRELGINPEIVNTSGGAIALGHPIGLSGARVARQRAAS